MDPRITRRTGLAATALAAVGLPGIGLSAAHAMGDPAPHKERPSMKEARTAPHWGGKGNRRHPWDRRGSGRTLREASPTSVGLDPAELDRILGIPHDAA